MSIYTVDNISGHSQGQDKKKMTPTLWSNRSNSIRCIQLHIQWKTWECRPNWTSKGENNMRRVSEDDVGNEMKGNNRTSKNVRNQNTSRLAFASSDMFGCVYV